MKKKSKNVVAVNFDDTYGNISSGTGSDNFFVNDNFDVDISNTPTVEEKLTRKQQMNLIQVQKQLKIKNNSLKIII